MNDAEDIPPGSWINLACHRREAWQETQAGTSITPDGDEMPPLHMEAITGKA